jgi:hypothetical protein
MCGDLPSNTPMFQTQWLGKRQNGRIERLSKVAVEQKKKKTGENQSKATRR